MSSRPVSTDTTINSVMHWYYTSWAFTYLAYLNNLPINVHYFTQRETWTQVFSKNSIKPASQLSSLKRVRWNVTKTLTLSEIHRTGSIVGASANWEAPCLSLRKKVDIFVYWFYHFLSYLTVYSFLAYSL